MTTALLEHRCKRCDPDAQCADCLRNQQSRTLCTCTHTRAVHHHGGLGCLSWVAGKLCRCNRFEQMPEGSDE